MGPRSSKKKKRKSKKKIFINGHLRLDKLYIIIPLVLILFVTMKGSFAYINNKIKPKLDLKKVEVTDVSIYKKTSGANILYDSSVSNNKVSFNLCLSQNSDYITYIIILKNNTDKDQKLNKISLETTNNNSITYKLENFETGDIIKASSGQVVKLTIRYKEDLEKISNKCVGMTLRLDFIDN